MKVVADGDKKKLKIQRLTHFISTTITYSVQVDTLVLS